MSLIPCKKFDSNGNEIDNGIWYTYIGQVYNIPGSGFDRERARKSQWPTSCYCTSLGCDHSPSIVQAHVILSLDSGEHPVYLAALCHSCNKKEKQKHLYNGELILCLGVPSIHLS